MPTMNRTTSLRHIIDGDTLVLQDGKKLRLIGIDTPELARKGRPAEHGALRALSYLSELLGAKDRLRLKYGPERHDRHGRLLAHLFLADGSNVQASLLGKGLAVPLNIPPNILFSDCYERHAREARATQQGLWKLPEHQMIRAKALHPDSRGFRIVRGEVSRVGFSTSAVWLNLGEQLAIRIRKDELSYLPELNLDRLVGKEVEVRGILYQRNKQLRVSVRHGNDLKVEN